MRNLRLLVGVRAPRRGAVHRSPAADEREHARACHGRCQPRRTRRRRDLLWSGAAGGRSRHERRRRALHGRSRGGDRGDDIAVGLRWDRGRGGGRRGAESRFLDRKSTRLNSSHRCISYAVFCLKKKKKKNRQEKSQTKKSKNI